jgi:hypothetical protein
VGKLQGKVAVIDSRNQKHIEVGGQIKRAYARFMYANREFFSCGAVCARLESGPNRGICA